jgi:hypothetical protein
MTIYMTAEYVKLPLGCENTLASSMPSVASLDVSTTPSAHDQYFCTYLFNPVWFSTTVLPCARPAVSLILASCAASRFVAPASDMCAPCFVGSVGFGNSFNKSSLKRVLPQAASLSASTSAVLQSISAYKFLHYPFQLKANSLQLDKGIASLFQVP